MFKIAHISDLHLSYGNDKGRGANLVELLDDIAEKGCRHVIVTGDIADNPLREDLIYAREIFAQYDLVQHDRMSVVPGNHDIFGSAPEGPRGFMFSKICSEIDFGAMEEQFLNIFSDTFSGEPRFPYLKILDDIALIGINSLFEWSVEKNPEGSNGLIDGRRLKKIEKLLKSEEVAGKFKIVMLHHHFSKPKQVSEYPAHSLWLKGIAYKMDVHEPKKFLKLLGEHGVNLILHGHTHYTGVYMRKGLTFVNSSACSIPLTDDFQRKYMLISVPELPDEDKRVRLESINL